jgi:hypothetical protein
VPREELSGAAARKRARAVADVLRARRARAFRPSLYQAYFTLVATAIYGALAGHAIASAVGPGLSIRTLNAWGPAVLAALVLTAVRTGTWQGPVVFSQGDVAFVLAAPIPLATLVRPRLAQAFAVASVAGAIVGMLTVLASSSGPAGLGGPRLAGTLLAFAAMGLVATASSWLVERSVRLTGLALRAGALVILLAAALLVIAELGATGRSIAIWSGPWGWIVAPLCATPGWPFAVALSVLCAAAAVALAFRLATSAPTECFLAQAETRSRMTASAMTLDYRSAGLARREATATGPSSGRPAGARARVLGRRRRLGLGAGPGLPRRLGLRRPRRRERAVTWRDALAVVRAPSRAGWAGALCAAGTLEAISHPGRPLPCALAAIALYFAAAGLLEALRVDIDAPDKSRLLLSWEFGRVVLAHCTVPLIVLVGVGSTTIAVAAGFGVAGVGVLAVIPTVLAPTLACAVLCAALAARSGGRIGESVVLRVLTSGTSDPLGGISAVVWVAPWLLLEIVVVALPTLLLGHAAAHHRGVFAAGLWAGAISLCVAVTLRNVAARSRAEADADPGVRIGSADGAGPSQT